MAGTSFIAGDWNFSELGVTDSLMEEARIFSCTSADPGGLVVNCTGLDESGFPSVTGSGYRISNSQCAYVQKTPSKS